MHADNHESVRQIDTLIFVGDRQAFPKFPISLHYLKKEVRDEVDFLHIDKNQSFLQVNFNTLGIKVSYKVILSWIGMIKHYESTQNNKFAVSLQYLKREVRDGVHLLDVDKHQRFCNLVLSFLIEMARHFFKKKVSQLLLCSIVR